jgi:RNA polymerase sigma-70 factor (ECF subfamily)
MIADAKSMMASHAARTTDYLIEGAKVYSPQAWTELYDAHYLAIYRYCHFRCRDWAAAEDLAADVFLEALRSIHKFEQRGIPISAWLYRIAHNVTADHLRNVARRPLVPLEVAATTEASALREPDIADVSDRRKDITNALARLSEDYQQVLVLRFFQGFSHNETATIMGRRPGAVRVLQSRALSALRRAMAA